MQAIIFPEPETILIDQVDDPGCGPDEVIVQVAACGICGTDLHIYRNEYMSDFPFPWPNFRARSNDSPPGKRSKFTSGRALINRP